MIGQAKMAGGLLRRVCVVAAAEFGGSGGEVLSKSNPLSSTERLGTGRCAGR